MKTDGGFDVIGDVHGEYDALVRLLKKMGYDRSDGAWRHPERQAVFVGDLIDRGAEQVKVVTLVREMHDAGTAQVVMGNHEWNALAWATKDPENSGKFLRDNDDPEKRKQHERFLEQVGEGTPLHHEYLAWFRTLPMWLDLPGLRLDRPGLRVVHACWQNGQIEHIKDRTNGTGLVNDALLFGAHTKGSADHAAIETLLKGIEVPLPGGLTFFDKDNHQRSEARIKWWDPTARTFHSAALVDDDRVRDQLPKLPIPSASVEADDDPRPVIFGHYWFRGDTPSVQSKKAVCVDYSVAKGGSLVAYQWSGETDLVKTNMVAVRA